MHYRHPARVALDAELERLQQDQLLVLELAELRHLVTDPPDDPFVVARGPQRSGVEDLAATLTAARRLPDELTVRVVLPAGVAVEPSVAEVEAALHRRAAFQSTVAWREGMAVRSMGRSQFPMGFTIAVIAWAVSGLATAAAANAVGIELVVLAVISMIGITVAWVVSWMVVESSLLDWRMGARRSAAYDLLSRARLEVTVEG